jgi:hypothetical protein
MDGYGQCTLYACMEISQRISLICINNMLIKIDIKKINKCSGLTWLFKSFSAEQLC